MSECLIYLYMLCIDKVAVCGVSKICYDKTSEWEPCKKWDEIVRSVT